MQFFFKKSYIIKKFNLKFTTFFKREFKNSKKLKYGENLQERILGCNKNYLWVQKPNFYQLYANGRECLGADWPFSSL